MDLLGLGMMAVLEECLELIPKHYEEKVDLAQLPADDSTVYKTLRSADTVGMFQVESRAQMSSLPRNAPAKFMTLLCKSRLSARADCRKNDASVYAKATGKRASDIRAPLAGAGAEADVGCAVVSGTVAAHVHDCGKFFWWRSRGFAPRHGFKRSQERMHDIESKLRRGMTQNGISPRRSKKSSRKLLRSRNSAFPNRTRQVLR